ncbi:MAG: hypothetical protein ACEPOZ_13555 [Marinifilaceae bacterium]
MKNKVRLLVMVIAILTFSFPKPTQAQVSEGNFFIVTTWKTVMPQDGNAAERDSLLMEWIVDVLRKNDKIISEKSLRHFYGSDLRDWVIITEYKSWADIEASWKKSEELMKLKWPDEKERGMYFKKLMKYFPEHSDEIYRELPKFAK